jgi:putative acetyltransferase
VPSFVDTLTHRAATAAYVPALARLHAGTARVPGPAVYSALQVDAWVGFGKDTPAFRAYVLDADTWLALGTDGQAVGFCGVGGQGDWGEVHSLYVRHGHVRRGLGSRLLGDALMRARRRGQQHFAAWVTPFSRPVFERADIRLVRTVVEPHQDGEFERYRVELRA